MPEGVIQQDKLDAEIDKVAKDYVYTKNNREYIKLTLDPSLAGGKEALEISSRIAMTLASKGVSFLKNGKPVVVEIDYQLFKKVVKDLYNQDGKGIPLASFIKEGKKTPPSTQRIAEVGGVLSNQGTEVFAGVGIEHKEGTEQASAAAGIKVSGDGTKLGVKGKKNNAEASIGATLGRSFQLRAGGSLMFAGALPLVGFQIGEGGVAFQSLFLNPMNTLVVGMINNAIQQGFKAAEEGKNLVEKGVRFVLGSTGILQAWEAAEKEKNILEGIWRFIQEFVKFWIEMVKKAIEMFVEAVDYLIALIKDPGKVKVEDDKKAVGIVEKMRSSASRKNWEEVEDYVYATKGQGPGWFRGINLFYEDMVWAYNYGLFKNPLAIWKWGMDKSKAIKEKEQDTINFFSNVQIVASELGIKFADAKPEKLDSLLKYLNNPAEYKGDNEKVKEALEEIQQYIQKYKLESAEKALVAAAIYLTFKLATPEVSYLDKDYLEVLLREKEFPSRLVVHAATKGTPGDMIWLHVNPQLSFVGHDLAVYGDYSSIQQVLMSGRFKPYITEMNEEQREEMLNQLTEIFSQLPSQVVMNYFENTLETVTSFNDENEELLRFMWRLWNNIKKEKADLPNSFFEFSMLLGMDDSWEYKDFVLAQDKSFQRLFNLYRKIISTEDENKRMELMERFLDEWKTTVGEGKEVSASLLLAGLFYAQNEEEFLYWAKVVLLGELSTYNTSTFTNLQGIESYDEKEARFWQTLAQYNETRASKTDENHPERPQTES
ncbi:MAG: hypothetical protein GXN92_00705 [Candidatus Micrarchaeota archaeon]|nr:hypothetical protein [Candidatus Micrarchaeota archaeon]